MLTSGVRNATAALIEQEQSQEDDEVEDHPRCKDKRCRAEPEEDSMADETRGDDDGSRDQAAAGDGGDREGEDSVDEVVPPRRRGKQSLPSIGLVLTIVLMITLPQVRNQGNEEEADEENAGEENSRRKEGTGM